MPSVSLESNESQAAHWSIRRYGEKPHHSFRIRLKLGYGTQSTFDGLMRADLQALFDLIEYELRTNG
jgi:hypothetical protein